MQRVHHLILATGLWLCASGAYGGADEACQAGSCEAVQGAAMLQSKFQRGRAHVEKKKNRTTLEQQAVVAKRRQHARVLESDGRRMFEYEGVWVASAWGSCSSGCSPPAKARTLTCKSVETGTELDDSACSHKMPETVEACSCEMERCVDTAASDCDIPTETAPALPDDDHEVNFVYVGCFKLDDDDSTDGEFMDKTCLDYSGSGKCRSGLAFFTEQSTTPEACSLFCLGKGMDIFALVSGSACRCGASKINKGAFHEAEPRADYLVFDDMALEDDIDQDEGETESVCPLEVYRYTGFYVLDGIPLSHLHPMVDTSAYIDSIVMGKTKSPEEEEDKLGVKEQLLQNVAPWDRPCYPENCGVGKGPWKERRDHGPTDDPSFEDKFEEYTWVPYWFTDKIDDVRKESWESAAMAWYTDTCIVLYETDSQPNKGITVDVIDENSCYVSGMGNGKSTVNLGWCKDAAHVGNMIHEIGHALGMKHEQARMDAGQEYHGKGPFLDIHWDEIESSWKSQYVGSPGEYLGSADDGSGDPYVGYAPYDFGSIMHYPGGAAFDTIPGYKEAFVGQRTGLAHSDIMQIFDMYQCKMKAGFTMPPTPAPATVITVAGACDPGCFSINGDYASQGETASGATWYKMPGGLALFFDPSCNGGTSSPRWTLDNDDPDVTAKNDLDGDGGCTYWGKVDVKGKNIAYPESKTWRVYCPSNGGWSNNNLVIGPWTEPVPTPEPPDPTPAPPTPAPTMPACIGDASTWNSGWGGCPTYTPGSANGPYCKMDQAGGLYASQVCGECIMCDAPGGGAAAAPYTKLPGKKPIMCKDMLKVGKKVALFRKMTEEACAEKCEKTKNCGFFSYKALAGGKAKPGICRLSQACQQQIKSKAATNFATFKMAS